MLEEAIPTTMLDRADEKMSVEGSLTEQFNVGVVGAGYVGIVTGACLAYVGHEVNCVDKDLERVAEPREEKSQSTSRASRRS